MTRTNWDLMISGRELSAEKNLRKKLYVSQKILAKDLPEYIDAGWEKAKDFKNPKYVGITKEKSVDDQLEDRVWMLFANMGFSALNTGKDFSMAYIIDGQHRLYGYSDSMYATTNTIPVVAFVDLERSEQIKLFMDINENQKAVPKSLRVTLNADMLWESNDYSERRQALRSKIAQMLGEETTSPLHSRVVIGENESTPDRCITVEAIQSALRRCRFFDAYGKKNVLQKAGTFDCGDNQETCDLFYPFIEKCLLYIRGACLSEWDKGDRDSGMLTMNRGIQAVIRVIDDIVNMLVDKGMITPKAQDLDDMFGLIQYYLKPLTDYINAFEDEDKQARILAMAKRDVEWLKAKYENLASFAEVIKAINEFLEVA